MQKKGTRLLLVIKEKREKTQTHTKRKALTIVHGKKNGIKLHIIAT
jgi:hypothetical protein